METVIVQSMEGENFSENSLRKTTWGTLEKYVKLLESNVALTMVVGSRDMLSVAFSTCMHRRISALSYVPYGENPSIIQSP